MGRSQPWKERVDRRKLKVVVTRWITDYTVVVQLISRAQLFCDPKDCSPPGSSVRGISQARTLEWAAISFSRGSSRPRVGTLSPEPPGSPCKPLSSVLTLKVHRSQLSYGVKCEPQSKSVFLKVSLAIQSDHWSPLQSRYIRI